jgi:peptidoglycan/LPS O-acetylase OafA/YrhL
VGSADAYGIYLSHMLFITALTWLGWGKLSSAAPWPLLCAATVVIVFACCIALTGLLARTPLAVPLTGRAQVPWPRPEAAIQAAAAQAAASGLSRPEPAVLAAAYEKNGT